MRFDCNDAEGRVMVRCHAAHPGEEIVPEATIVVRFHLGAPVDIDLPLCATHDRLMVAYAIAGRVPYGRRPIAEPAPPEPSA